MTDESADDPGEPGRGRRDSTDDHAGATPSRRRILEMVGAIGLGGLAGCAGDGTSTQPTDTTTATDATAPTTADAPTETATSTGTETPTAETTTGEPTPTTTRTPTEPPDPSDHRRTILSDGMNNLVDLTVTPDGRILYITRGAAFRATVRDTAEIGVLDPTGSGAVSESVALSLPVFVGLSDGGLGITVDPDFEENGWVYVYYSPTNEAVAETDAQRTYLDRAGSDRRSMARPPSESIGNPYNRLARFTMVDGSIDPASEVEILRVPVQRDTCCHPGGAVEFGPEGHLYLTTGDNTYALASTDPGTAPLDEREDLEYFDAQRSSGDTADLRGKILRITPRADGSYAIPEGNLKDIHEAETGESFEEATFRPEIYAMGFRNPYQASVDPETGTLFWGDYAADSREWHPDRGPPGFNEFNRATEPGNYGWPYFSGPYAYVDYDYASGESGDRFDPAGPTNDSPHSDGLTELPPVEDPLVWYPGDWGALDDAPDYVDLVNDGEPAFPTIEGGAPTCGPVFRYDPSFAERGLHAWYDGELFVGEWNRDWIRTVSFEGGVADGDVAEIRPFMPDAEFEAPIAMEIGPRGALYVAEYGGRYETADSRISMITRA